MLHKLILEAARSHEFPDGSPTHGYELLLPLTPAGTLDHDHWLHHRQDSRFRRFWGLEEERRGHLTHNRRGWALAFEDGSDDAEVILRADDHRFIAGEYISIKEHDGVTRTFRIASVG